MKSPPKPGGLFLFHTLLIFNFDRSIKPDGMNLIFFDDQTRENLLPLTYTRPVCELRVGILTIRDKWEKQLNLKGSFVTQDYLREKFPMNLGEDNLFINGSILPDKNLVAGIRDLKTGSRLMSGEIILAQRVAGTALEGFEKSAKLPAAETINYPEKVNKIEYSWDLFARNEQAIADDFAFLTAGRKSQPIPVSNKCIQPENIFLEEGVKVECAILNASTGPIYLAKDSEVMEGAMIRGPFSLGEHAQVKMGAKIYGATTIGPECRVGGEISNSVILGYSNKGHDGFLGNSVLGEWCNLGADSNNSNLKNNYSKVKVWSYKEEQFINTGLQFCGLIMGDHSKCSINTMFNTGTVVGVSANIYGNGFPPKFVPSFSWGGSEGFKTYRIEEAVEVAQRVYERRKMEFNAAEQKILKHLFDFTTKYRAW